MSEQSHRSDPRILNRRTLQHDHRRLAELLRPGMSVLDVGCGTGAITAGIAARVSPDGRAVGLDRDDTLLTVGRQEYRAVTNLSFENGDVLALHFENCFDIVTAARTLQWTSEPARAIRRMIQAAKAGGIVVVLDYNHEDNSWDPDPPPEFHRFYNSFLDWRTANNWNNRIAAHLPELFRLAGLTGIAIHVQDEIVERSDPDFPVASGIWTNVIQSLGPQLVTAGFLDEDERVRAEEGYQRYVRTGLQRQRLSMRAIEGTVT